MAPPTRLDRYVSRKGGELIFFEIIVASIVIGAALAFVIDRLRQRSRSVQTQEASASAGRILDEARKEAEVIRKEAEVQSKHAALEAQQEAERDTRERRRE